MIYRFVVLSVVMVLSLSRVVGAAEINLNQMDALVETCVRLIQAEDFKGLAMLYHYPPEFTEDELETDLHAVESSLKIFTEEFGRFDEVAPLESGDLYLNIFAAGGTHKYWQQHPDAYKVELTTNFENYGPGYLVIQVVDLVGTLEVKAIAFGLPVSGQSVERIKRAGDRMMMLMHQVTAEPEQAKQL